MKSENNDMPYIIEIPDYLDTDEYFDTNDGTDEEIELEKIRHRLKKGKLLQRDIHISMWFFAVLFLGMIAYMAYFCLEKADGYLSSEYNTIRQSVYEDRYIRGEIISSDGKTLATTVTDSDGTETRYYPEGRLFAQTVGYSTRGKTGLEAVSNSYLLGSHINPFNRMYKELSGKKIKADTVVTSLRHDMQKTAFDALGDYKGAVIVMEVKTGRILAMVSKPDFNPNEINSIWEELTGNSSNSNLVNRATQGLYPPGSTFKILMTLEYIRENPDFGDFTFECDSIYETGDYSVKCSKGTDHGEVDLKEAFARSCNGAFAFLGQTLSIGKLNNLAMEAGYNSKLPIDINSNKSTFNLEKDAGLFDILQTSIGQGETLCTPLQNLLIAAAVANDGKIPKPMLLDEIVSSDGRVVKRFSPETYKKIMSSSECEVLKEYMRAVVTDGTGSKAQGDGYAAAGKTGSAEWKSGQDTHAWFVGFAPYEEPEIAVCVIAENAGSGGSIAAPMAREIFDEYFSIKH